MTVGAGAGATLTRRVAAEQLREGQVLRAESGGADGLGVTPGDRKEPDDRRLPVTRESDTHRGGKAEVAPVGAGQASRRVCRA